MKTYNNTNQEEAKERVKDIEFFGKNLFLCANKASSKNEQWMKSTKICNLPNGCIVQCSTQQKDNVAETLQFVPNVNYDFEKEEFILVYNDLITAEPLQAIPDTK